MTPEELDKFVGRPFSFYPPVVNIEHNEWSYLKGTWSEVLVKNAKTGMEIWVPRRYLGEISRVDEPVMIIGLNRELEYTAGAVWPHKRRVVRMQGPSKPPPPESGNVEVPPPPPRGSGSPAERRLGRLIIGSLALAIILTFLGVTIVQRRQSGGRIDYKAVLQTDLALNAHDDYFSVVRKLGKPAGERWLAETGERQFEALDYPKIGVTVILMGADRENVHYIGAKDRDWKTVHSVTLPGGASTDSMLRALEPF